MRPSENVKSSNGMKASLNVKAGPLMRLPIKKIYCPKCQRLIKGQTQSPNSATQVVCPRCSQSLWFWKSTTWRSAGNRTDVSP